MTRRRPDRLSTEKLVFRGAARLYSRPFASTKNETRIIGNQSERAGKRKGARGAQAGRESNLIGSLERIKEVDAARMNGGCILSRLQIGFALFGKKKSIQIHMNGLNAPKTLANGIIFFGPKNNKERKVILPESTSVA